MPIALFLNFCFDIKGYYGWHKVGYSQLDIILIFWEPRGRKGGRKTALSYY